MDIYQVESDSIKEELLRIVQQEWTYRVTIGFNKYDYHGGKDLFKKGDEVNDALIEKIIESLSEGEILEISNMDSCSYSSDYFIKLFGETYTIVKQGIYC